jgi:Flp pilus assembly protein TadG
MTFRRTDIVALAQQAGCRRGATLVEVAIVLPVTFFLIIALAVGALGVFRYQEVASLTRAAGRYAATHGAQHRKDAGLAKGTAADWHADIFANAIQPAMVLLDSSQLMFQSSWPDVSNLPGTPDNWPNSTVTVTISYQWFPEFLLVGPYHMTSTSCTTISN